MYLAAGDAIMKQFPDAPSWSAPALAVACLFNLVCAIAVFMWKKWGVWGFCLSSVAAVVLNLMIGLGIGQSLGGLIGMVIFIGVLNIGNENKGWPQLD